jgi:hypothetical protein
MFTSVVECEISTALDRNSIFLFQLLLIYNRHYLEILQEIHLIDYFETSFNLL